MFVELLINPSESSGPLPKGCNHSLQNFVQEEASCSNIARASYDACAIRDTFPQAKCHVYRAAYLHTVLNNPLTTIIN